MAGIITQWWLVAYIILAIIIFLGLLYSYIISIDELRKPLLSLLSATTIINAAIIVHTVAILKYGMDNAQMMEFVAGHILLLIGFIVLISSGSRIMKLSKKIGFGG